MSGGVAYAEMLTSGGGEARLHVRLYGPNGSLGVLGEIQIHCRRSERNDDGCVHAIRQASHAHQAAIRSLLAAKVYFVCLVGCTSWRASVASTGVMYQRALGTLGEFAVFRPFHGIALRRGRAEQQKARRGAIPLPPPPSGREGLRSVPSWMECALAWVLQRFPASIRGVLPLAPHLVYATNAVVDAGVHVLDETYLPACGPWWHYIAKADIEKTFLEKGVVGPFLKRWEEERRGPPVRQPAGLCLRSRRLPVLRARQGGSPDAGALQSCTTSWWRCGPAWRRSWT